MRARSLPALLLVAAVLGACAGGDRIHVQARFDDIADLAGGAPVMLADITIGKVTGIELDGTEAVVTMAIDRSAAVPEGVTARVRRTTLLGERIVDLALPENVPADAPLLEDGSTIGDTETRPDLEDLVREGNDVLSPIAASEVATLVDEGAKGFGGRGEDLEGLLLNLGTIVEGYAGATDDIEALIDSLNRLNTTIAREAEAHAQAIASSEQAVSVLNEESDELETAIEELARLSVGANELFHEHADEMDRSFEQLRVILTVLAEQQAALEQILRFAPLHNRNTQLVEHNEFNQILQDFIICGLNDDPTDPARTCSADGPNPRER